MPYFEDWGRYGNRITVKLNYQNVEQPAYFFPVEEAGQWDVFIQDEKDPLEWEVKIEAANFDASSNYAWGKYTYPPSREGEDVYVELVPWDEDPRVIPQEDPVDLSGGSE